MSAPGFVPVTFRNKILGMSKELNERTTERERRQDEFNRRLKEFVSRYERVIALRLRRLREEGIILDLDNIRERSKTELAMDRAARKSKSNNIEGLRVDKHTSDIEQHVDKQVQETPALKLELSFHVQLPVIKEGSGSHLPLKKGRSSKSPQSRKSSAGKQNFQRMCNKIVSVQRFTERRHTIVPLHVNNVSKDSNVPNSLILETPGRCSLHTVCNFSCKGRVATGLTKSQSFDQKFGIGLSGNTHHSNEANAKMKRAVRKLGTVRTIQTYL